MKFRKNQGLLFWVLILSLPSLWPRQVSGGEVITQPEETLPGLKHEKLFDMTGFDRVNVFSGDVQLTVPLGPSYPVTAGFSYQLTAHYSSKIWHMELAECQAWVDECGTHVMRGRAKLAGDPSLGAGWTLGVERIEVVTYLGAQRYYLVGADGSRREFKGSAGVFEPEDGSDLRLETLSGGGYAMKTPDGAVWYFQHGHGKPGSPNGWDFFPAGQQEPTITRYGLSSVDDRFGNVDVMTVTYEPADPWKIKEIRLAGDRTITFFWNNFGAWPVIEKVRFPTVHGKTLEAKFGRSGPGFPRTFFRSATRSSNPRRSSMDHRR